jgi:hypothetical protein
MTPAHNRVTLHPRGGLGMAGASPASCSGGGRGSVLKRTTLSCTKLRTKRGTEFLERAEAKRMLWLGLGSTGARTAMTLAAMELCSHGGWR